MAQCAYILALVLPFLVVIAHVNFSTDRRLTASSCRCGCYQTTRSPSTRQPPSSTRAGSSILGMAAIDEDAYHWKSIPSPRTERELEPEPAVVAQVKNTGLTAVDMVQRMEHLAKVLRLFGYKGMASAVPLMANSWVLRMWSDTITIFAVPDAAFELACPGCPLRPLVLKQVALGSQSFSKLSSQPSFKITTAAVGFCMSSLTTIVWSVGGDLTKVVSINSVEITRPDLYNDGRFIVHGVKSYIHLPASGSCTASRNDGSLSLSKVIGKILGID